MEKYQIQVNPLDEAELAEMWPVESFITAYSQIKAKLSGASVLTLSDSSVANKTAILIVRLFIEDSRRLKCNQKYILGLRFYSFGEIATIDIIALDEEYHREIAYNHLMQMNWPMLNEDERNFSKTLEFNMHTPCAISGGHLKINSQNQVCFLGQSQDYGREILTFDGNEIVNFLASTIPGIQVASSNLSIGKKFVQQIMEIMLKHNNQPDFYEQLCSEIYLINSHFDNLLTSQQTGALIMMKVADRSLIENRDQLSLVIDEFTSGLSRSIMLASISKRIRQEKNQPNDLN